jgi:hypothetical protein
MTQCASHPEFAAQEGAHLGMGRVQSHSWLKGVPVNNGKHMLKAGEGASSTVIPVHMKAP